MMNPEIKNKWVEALRSGKYKQGTKLLRKNDRFCCLGVLCDVIDDSRWKISVPKFKTFEYENFTAALPQHILDETNLQSLDQSVLMAMNDGEGKSFKEIADWIEESL